MTTWFVTRHVGAEEWARQEGFLEERSPHKVVSSLDPVQDIRFGDVVIGTLPVHLAAQICARGARYFHLAMQVPDSFRGKELTAQEMRLFDANLQEFVVLGQQPLIRANTRPDAPSVHVCLVSDQHFANLLPVLKRRPKRIELVCTPEMALPGSGLDRLARSLEHFGYGASEILPHLVDGACSTDFETARKAARELRQELVDRYPQATITLNATGGTKTLSTAFFLEFQGFETIYTDTPGNVIRFLDNQQRQPEPMGELITSVDDYFYCQGYQVVRSESREARWPVTASKRRAVTQFLARHGALPAIGILNTSKAEIEKHLLGPDGSRQLPASQRNEIVEKGLGQCWIKRLKPSYFTQRLVDENLLHADAAGKFFFAGLGALAYLTGGWLEEWAWLCATDCGAQVVEANVAIKALTDNVGAPEDDKEDNELDLVVLHNNRLLIAECKTISWKGVNAKQEIFNKLDALGHHARGLFGKSILISAKELDPLADRRAKAYGISVVHTKGLMTLTDEIQRSLRI